MINRQEEILYKLADKHGITRTQAKEIWRLLTGKIAETISEEKKENGEYVKENFKVIHIHNFGKFIPNYKRINFANMCLTKEREKKDD